MDGPVSAGQCVNKQVGMLQRCHHKPDFYFVTATRNLRSVLHVTADLAVLEAVA